MKSSFNRRAFLAGGAAVGAAGLLPLSSHAAVGRARAGDGGPGSPIQLGIASYTFRTFDPAKLMASAKELKITHLNLKDVHLPMTPADQVSARAAAYRAAGFTLTAAGTIYFLKDEDEDVRSKFEYVKAAGIPMMVAAPTHATIARVEKFAKEYDVRIAIHNHGPEDKEWPSPLDVLKVVKTMDPRMGCCVDVGHCTRAGVSPVEAIHQAGARVLDVHMKDLAQPNAKESQVAVGEGIIPVPAIFAALESVGYKGFVDLEYEIFPENPMPGVTESFAYMRGVLAGMGHKG